MFLFAGGQSGDRSQPLTKIRPNPSTRHCHKLYNDDDDDNNDDDDDNNNNNNNTEVRTPPIYFTNLKFFFLEVLN